MIRLATANGQRTPHVLPTEFETDKAAQDARRTAGMAFLKEAGLTLDDRLMSDQVQDIIDGLLFRDANGTAGDTAGGKAA